MKFPCTRIHDKVTSFMLVITFVTYVGFIKSPTTFFIDVLTWCGQQKVLEAPFFNFAFLL